MPKKILFLIPYPLNESPSQRFRFEQYFGLLTNNGFRFETQSFLTAQNWQLFYKPGRLIPKTLAVIEGFIRRISVLIRAAGYDFVFIHREATPIGPPVIEWFLRMVLNKKIIYDFDDAIWLTDKNNESGVTRLFKWRRKVASICRWSYKVSCGNQYLLEFAKKNNANAVLNPTTIDTEQVHNPILYQKAKLENAIVVGWTGSHSTLKYLGKAVNVLRRIEDKFPNVRVVVIADRAPDLKLRTLQYLPWKPESEIADLMTLDIGIMPLPDDIWTKGKCGFKALQYMSLKIPAVASPVGVNTAIIDDGVNGFLCNSAEDWETALTMLIRDKNLRQKMGELGRTKVINSYSVLSNSATFLALFE
jgi:glycosyltransferase involved in cell wall biosynthesis